MPRVGLRWPGGKPPSVAGAAIATIDQPQGKVPTARASVARTFFFM